MLVVIGATSEGKKELLVDLKGKGLTIAPELATGDGALGFWKALDQVFPKTRHQRCTVHKTANILNKVPKSIQPQAKHDLRQIWTAPDRTTAKKAINIFVEKDGPKYDKAVQCLVKDRDRLLAFFDFPAEHWDHIRTTNPIESVFATVRHRTVRTKGALSQTTAKLKGDKLLPKVVEGVTFKDGIEAVEQSTNVAA